MNHNSHTLKILLGLLGLFGWTGCSRTLDGRDQLKVNASPPYLSVATSPLCPVGIQSTEMSPCRPATDFQSAAGCTTHGGSVVTVQGIRSDGSLAAGFRADVLSDSDGTASATLLPLAAPPVLDAGPLSAPTGNPGDSGILNADGRASYCLIPGETPGTVTLLARSGLIESSPKTEIPILAAALPAGSTLKLSVSSSLFSLRPNLIWDCAKPTPSDCMPTSAPYRYALITAIPTLPAMSVKLPSTASIWLSTDHGVFGTLSATGMPRTDSKPSPTAELTYQFASGSGGDSAVLRLDDAGAQVNLGASSGSVSTQLMPALPVPAIPYTIDLTTTTMKVSPGADVSFTARVRGCDGSAIGGIEISQTADGALDPKSPPSVQTDAQGSTVLAATAHAGIMMGQGSLTVRVNGAPGIMCQRSVTIGN